MNGQDSKDAMGEQLPFHMIMDIEPDSGCPHCGCRKWTECLVDTSQREDLFTRKPVFGWMGRSDCLICGETLFWTIDPDGGVQERHSQ